MKKYPFVATLFQLFFCLFVFFPATLAQKSFEFANILPVEAQPITSVAPQFFGNYESDKGKEFTYEFNDKGIFLKTINIQAISQKTIRETGKYKVQNGYLFGVNEDSIPCFFEDSNYYFGVRNSIQLVGADIANQLCLNSPTSYILNSKSEHGFVPMLLEFKNNQLIISSFDYDAEGTIFKKIKDQQQLVLENNPLSIYLLQPTLKEWQKTAKKEIFRNPRVFIKQ
ncbi:MAG TPA: hypothetical protein PKN22_05070 [Taishania sp.]|nr:hypothetical protein [Taishania sp.]HNS42109.1 hypothetical protein [Taishania sp.]